METPVMDTLRAMKGRAWLHMPGHAGMLEYLDAALDVTELPISDDLHAPAKGGAFARAQELMARACGAGASIFLTGGSTLGIHAMLTAFVQPGQKVILPRDAHKAAIAACAIGDLRPVYVWPRIEDKKAFLCAADLLAALEEHPDAQAVYITRPDSFGVCADIRPVIECARGMGMRVLVDEAHGAHFPYGGDIPSAGALGADAWVQSAHKTLPALTQAACLHVRDAADAPMLAERASLLGTSSPSFLIAASLDGARAQLEESGQKTIQDAVKRNDLFHKRVQSMGLQNAYTAWQGAGYACDATRIALDVRVLGYSGYDAANMLSDRGVDVEMADAYRIVALPPLYGGDAHVERLAAALEALPAAKERGERIFPDFPRLESVLPPRDAVFGAKEYVCGCGVAGRVAACSVGLYPPGVPLATPGERLTEEFVCAVSGARNAGAQVFGVREDGCFLVVRKGT